MRAGCHRWGGDPSTDQRPIRAMILRGCYLDNSSFTAKTTTATVTTPVPGELTLTRPWGADRARSSDFANRSCSARHAQPWSLR